ncbi:response regulator, partial [bacterium]|nr:response regulator [candidate division CSSED10-310 bacterium]
MKIKTILIVEDEPDISALVSIILKKSGFVVLQAENGLDALKIARKTIPDLIISDIMMPKMN